MADKFILSPDVMVSISKHYNLQLLLLRSHLVTLRTFVKRRRLSEEARLANLALCPPKYSALWLLQAAHCHPANGMGEVVEEGNQQYLSSLSSSIVDMYREVEDHGGPP